MLVLLSLRRRTAPDDGVGICPSQAPLRLGGKFCRGIRHCGASHSSFRPSRQSLKYSFSRYLTRAICDGVLGVPDDHTLIDWAFAAGKGVTGAIFSIY